MAASMHNSEFPIDNAMTMETLARPGTSATN